MFFTDDLLTRKKGALGTIWLAATLGLRTKRLTRHDLKAVNLTRTCELIAEPPEPLALRLSGALLVGVARVYDRNYQIFYSDVTNFHTTIRRSLAPGGKDSLQGSEGASVDMVGDGKSRYENITFTGVDTAIMSGFTFELEYINWHDPLGTRKRRRATSKLDSLPSQLEEADEEEEDEQGLDDETEDGSLPPVGRSKRPRVVGSSPFIANVPPRKASSMYGSSDHGDALNQAFDFPLEEGIDLGLMGDIGEPVFGTHESGTPGQIAQDGIIKVPDTYMVDGELFMTDQPNKKRAGSYEGLSDVEQVLETTEPPKRTKKQKRGAFDASLELSDEETTVDRYLERMDEEGQALFIRQKAKAESDQTEHFISGVAGIDFFNPDMCAFIQTVFKPSAFKWELDVTAHKDRKPVQVHGVTQGGHGQPHLQEDVFGPIDFQQGYTGNDFITGRGVRGESEMPEIGRRGSRMGNHSDLPWMESAMKHRASMDLGGFDSSFTPGTLRLSMMTPQEMRIRLHRGSSLDSSGNRHMGGSSVSSLLGGADDGALGLVGDDDLELPGRDYDLNITESQADRRTQFPHAFKPELLASLETQCRVFLSTVESKMVEMGRDSLQFEDLAPRSSSKQAAVRAFYNCLTLVTKRMAAVEQHESFGPIHIQLTA